MSDRLMGKALGIPGLGGRTFAIDPTDNTEKKTNTPIVANYNYIRGPRVDASEDPTRGNWVFTIRDTLNDKEPRQFYHHLSVQCLNRLLYEDSLLSKDEQVWQTADNIKGTFNFLGVCDVFQPTDDSWRMGREECHGLMDVVIAGEANDVINLWRESYSPSSDPVCSKLMKCYFNLVKRPRDDTAHLDYMRLKEQARKKRLQKGTIPDHENPLYDQPTHKAQRLHGGGKRLGSGGVLSRHASDLRRKLRQYGKERKVSEEEEEKRHDITALNDEDLDEEDEKRKEDDENHDSEDAESEDLNREMTLKDVPLKWQYEPWASFNGKPPSPKDYMSFEEGWVGDTKYVGTSNWTRSQIHHRDSAVRMRSWLFPKFAGEGFKKIVGELPLFDIFLQQ